MRSGPVPERDEPYQISPESFGLSVSPSFVIMISPIKYRLPSVKQSLGEVSHGIPYSEETYGEYSDEDEENIC